MTWQFEGEMPELEVVSSYCRGWRLTQGTAWISCHIVLLIILLIITRKCRPVQWHHATGMASRNDIKSFGAAV